MSSFANWMRIGLLLGVVALSSTTISWSQDSTPTTSKTGNQSDQTPDVDNNQTVKNEQQAREDEIRRKGLLQSVTIFVLAIFVGFEVITKVPPTLHTPLMSGSNAISGITLVGAIIVAGTAGGFASFVAMIAVVLAAINAVGGFMVTHRMLSMFQRKKV